MRIHDLLFKNAPPNEENSVQQLVPQIKNFIEQKLNIPFHKVEVANGVSDGTVSIKFFGDKIKLETVANTMTDSAGEIPQLAAVIQERFKLPINTVYIGYKDSYSRPNRGVFLGVIVNPTNHGK